MQQNTAESALHAVQDLQAQLFSEQQASAQSEAQLQTVRWQREELEAQLTGARNPVADTQPIASQGSEPPLMLPAQSEPQVCPAPERQPNMKSHRL